MLNLPADLADCISNAPEETLAYGRRLALILPRPCLVLLRGELGAGKTMLANGLAEGLGVASASEVSSPTYTLIHEYSGEAVDFYHIDLYRLATPRDLSSLGLEDLFRRRVKPAVLAIEWGEKLAELGDFAGMDCLEIELRAVDGEQRSIRARAMRLTQMGKIQNRADNASGDLG